MVMLSNIIWVDPNIDNEENSIYFKELQSLSFLNIKCFKNIEEALTQIKKIEFEQTFIILSGRLYVDFIIKFKENLKDIYVIPKIIIFTNNKDKLLNNSKEYHHFINHPFYNLGGIKTSFDEVKAFILNQKKENHKLLNMEDEGQLVFEYIDCKEKLILPILYKALLDSTTSNEKVEKFTQFLYNKYSKNYKTLEELLSQINLINNIPIELLCKYYIRIYTEESNFYVDLNKELRKGQRDMYLPYIKVLYEGIKLKSLLMSSNNLLYRGSKISNEEIKIIKEYQEKKIKDLPSSIVFSKSFLSFTKDRKIAENYLNSIYDDKEDKISKVLFILENNENIDYSISSHADIENISFYPTEREVLFLPFSSFEIKEIIEIKNGNQKMYEIRIIYLGKYLKEIEANKSFIESEKDLPNTEFKKEIIKFGLIKTRKYSKHKAFISKI